jgi:hypothetical protein
MHLFRLSWAKLPPILFFAVLLLVGLRIYPDYGISFDEFWEWETGLITLKYLLERFAPHLLEQEPWLENIPPLETYIDSDHGITVALPLVVLKSLLGIKTWQGMFLFRHLANFLIFYLGVIFFYLLGRAHFRSRAWALLGCLMLVLSPRIFADAFYNSKDLPFLSFCILAAYTMVRFLQKPSYGWAAGHAFACALAIDTRMMGILLPAVTALMLLLVVLRQSKPAAAWYRPAALYVILLVVFIIALWPYLWADPVNRFLSIFEKMRHFRWRLTNLYLGTFIPANQLPWHYVSCWMLVTTPLSYSLFFLAGLGTLLLRLRQAREADLLLYIYPVFLLGALGAVAVLNTVLYDGWRHMFFVYFAFLMISLTGVHRLWHNTRLMSYDRLRHLLVVLVLGGNLLTVLWFMVKNHPHQNVYFSVISGETAARNFERDYWGLSYRQGLEFLLRHDKSAVIKYTAPDLPGHITTFILPEKDKQRLQYVPLEDISQATYFLSIYRWHPRPYPYQELYSINIAGLKIMSVFKIK